MGKRRQLSEDEKLNRYGPIVGTFRSKSNPDKVYEVRQKPGEEPSCNCPGWTRGMGDDGIRRCRHTAAVKGEI